MKALLRSLRCQIGIVYGAVYLCVPPMPLRIGYCILFPKVICVFGVICAVCVQVYVVPVFENTRAPVRRWRDQRAFRLGLNCRTCVVAAGCRLIVIIINFERSEVTAAPKVGIL